MKLDSEQSGHYNPAHWSPILYLAHILPNEQIASEREPAQAPALPKRLDVVIEWSQTGVGAGVGFARRSSKVMWSK